MSTPTLDQLLLEISQILAAKDGLKLQDFLVLEPPLPPLYISIVSELQSVFPVENETTLETKLTKFLPEDSEGETVGSWTAFASFLIQYFIFLRDVDVEQLVETHDMLKSLLNQCILALSDASMGFVMLPTVISFSRVLARLAIGLDKRPDLVASLTRRTSTVDGEDTEERITLVESSANVIREAFKKCLSERDGSSNGLNAMGKPAGRRVGIYVCANICLKLFFHCKKLRNAEQIFGNIYQLSPPLSRFPASQRVTYLYYLGRYLFANNHFFRAQLALQASYDQCHAQSLKQRRKILIYLISCNVILGRFPSPRLLQRPEAKGLGDKFLPVCQAIRKGDLASFRSFLDLNNNAATWFLQRRVLLQLQNRCEVLVWRSLARKTFLLTGFKGDTSKRAPSFDLANLLDLGIFLERKALATEHSQTNGIGQGTRRTHTNSIFIYPTIPSSQTNRRFKETDGYIDPDLEDEVESTGADLVSMDEVEAIVASLISQDLLHGYLSHKYLRFVITGAKLKSAIEIGFPNVWETIQSKVERVVPGWAQDGGENGTGHKAGPGTVVNLSGARPAGAPPE